MTKEAYAIYMSVKKSTFYLTGLQITLKSDHLPLKKFLRKMTLNDTVNNWSTEIENFNIKFVHISGKDNMLADISNRLIDIDPDLKHQPKLKDHEFGKYCFEALLKARGYAHHQNIGGEDYDMCVKYKLHMTTMKTWNFLLNYSWMVENLFSYRSETPKFEDYGTK